MMRTLLSLYHINSHVRCDVTSCYLLAIEVVVPCPFALTFKVIECNTYTYILPRWHLELAYLHVVVVAIYAQELVVVLLYISFIIARVVLLCAGKGLTQ